MPEEKRRYVRWREKIKVAYCLKEEEGFSEDVFTEDISESGLQILLADKLELKQMVRLKLEFIFDAVAIPLLAQVVYVEPGENQYRIGLEFIQIDDFQKQRLKAGLAKASKIG